jgi:peptide/nickel transport system ATP-binding protein
VTDVLDIQDLAVTASDGRAIARCERLAAGRGRVVAVVGPSGSGKTTLLRALAGALPTGSPRPDGTARVLGEDVFALEPAQLRAFRRERIGFVGQDPASRLNPRMKVRELLIESAGRRDIDLDAALTEVGLPTDQGLLRRRPGQLSGGQQRRAALARAFIREPDLLLLDEPTAGLDSSLRERLGELLRTRAEQRGTTIVLACHDLSLVDKLADEIVDLTESNQRSPVTARHRAPAAAAESTGGAELLQVSELHAWTGLRRKNPVLHGIELSLPAGDAVAVVGASGAGKTTLARAVAGLHTPVEGRVALDGDRIAPRAARRHRAHRRRIQLIPQDPLGTLNPSRTVGATLSRPLRLHRRARRRELPAMVADLLRTVGLSGDFGTRYPHELSGGQRQRVAIARALAADPDLLVCDEITASLDTATAEGVMELLSELRALRGMALVLISHDIPVIARHTGDVLVLDEGRLVEQGPTWEVLRAPRHPATEALCGSRHASPLPR